MHFEARIYKPYEDERYEEYDIEAESREAALEALQDPMSGVYFPDFGDRLLALIASDDDDDDA